MSDEPTQKDQPVEETALTPAEWVMPAPVFRSTDGHTPKSVAMSHEEEIDTENPDPDPLDITLDQSDEIANAETEEIPVFEEIPSVRAKPEQKKKGGCATSFLFTLGIIGFLATAIIIALVYFLFYAKPTETGTF